MIAVVLGKLATF